MKMIACFMLIIVGASAGVSAAVNMTERVNLLKLILSFIRKLKEMTVYNPKNLDEIIDELKSSNEFSGNKLINELDLTEIRENGFDSAWEKTLYNNGGYLKPTDKDLLSSFGIGLGKSDCETQSEHCGYFAEKLEQLIETANEEAQKKGRLYVSLGTMSGIFAVIMLI